MEINNLENTKGYCSIAKHALLLIFTFGIWFWIWIYRTTQYLNEEDESSFRNPTTQLLLCIFVPFYYIYWIYKSAETIDKLAIERGLESDIKTLCLILAIFFYIISPIIMQDKINSIIKVSEGVMQGSGYSSKKATDLRVEINVNASIESLLKRVELLLEDHNWDMARAYCNSMLDIEPENSQIYVYKLLAEYRVQDISCLERLIEPFENSDSYQKALRYSDETLRKKLEDCQSAADEYRLEKGREETYVKALDLLANAKSEAAYKNAADCFLRLNDYKDSQKLYEKCFVEIENLKENLKMEAEERQARKVEQKIKLKKTIKIAIPIVIVLGIGLAVYEMVIVPNNNYKQAEALFKSGQYVAALEQFESFGDYKNSAKRVIECKYNIALDFMEKEDYSQARGLFMELKGYEDADSLSKECNEKIGIQNTYDSALTLLSEGSLDKALKKFESLDLNYRDTKGWISVIKDIMPYEGDYKFVDDKTVAIARIHFGLNEEEQVVVKLRPGWFFEDGYYDASDSWVASVDKPLYRSDNGQYYFEAKYCGVARAWEFKKDKVKLYVDSSPDNEDFHATGIKQ